MKTNINEVTINGIVYIKKQTIQDKDCAVFNTPQNTNKVLVRTVAAGVFFGEIIELNYAECRVKLKDARRIWYWAGAASLSELATTGTSKPQNCKFPIAVNEITLFNVIEIIPCTETAINSINGVKIWKA